MELLQDLTEMRKVLNKRLLMKQLKSRGISSLIFGAIALFIGGSGISDNPINILLALIGVILILDGVWVLVSPSPIAYIVDGCTFIMLGAWNLFITINNSSGHSGSNAHWGILAVYQIVWGIQSFQQSKRAAEAISITTSQYQIDEVDTLLQTVSKASFKNNEHYFDFQQQGTLKNVFWKGILLDEHLVLVGANQDAIVAPKEDVKIIQKGKYRPGKSKTMKALFRATGREMTVIMPVKSLDRLQLWKPDVTASPVI